MKTIKILIAVLAISVNIAYAQFTKAELQVSGLTCSMCSKATEKSLRTLNFIGDIKADLNRNVFVLTFKKDMPVNLEMISKKIQGAGFFVNNLKVTFDFDTTKVIDGYFNYDGDTYRVVTPTDKPLSGLVAFNIVDKGFAPPIVIKKYNLGSTDASIKSGRVYHLAI